MWNPVELVAIVHRLDPEALEKFARDNFDKYKIVDEHGYCSVNTWHCNDLIRGFKKEQNEIEDTL